MTKHIEHSFSQDKMHIIMPNTEQLMRDKLADSLKEFHQWVDLIRSGEAEVTGLTVKRKLIRTPDCPKDLYQFGCEIEGVNLVCFLEYSPAEKGSTDSYGAPYEPDFEESMTLNNAYIYGTDVDIAHMILQGFVDHIEVSALKKFKDGDE